MIRMHKINPSRDGKAVIVLGPYDEGFVETLKRKVPPHAREWKPVARCWRIAAEYEGPAREAIEEFYREVEPC